MPFLSTTLKISLIIIAASHIAIASPVPELIDNGLSARQASGGSVNKATDGDSLLEGVEVLNIFSDNAGDGGKVDYGKPISHNKGVGDCNKGVGDCNKGVGDCNKDEGGYHKGIGGSSLAGTRYRQGNTVEHPAGAFGGFDESEQGGSGQGGSVNGGGGNLDILSGNGDDMEAKATDLE